MKCKHSALLCGMKYSRNPAAFIMSPSQQFISLSPFSVAVNRHPRQHGAAPRSVVGTVGGGGRRWRCIKIRLCKEDWFSFDFSVKDKVATDLIVFQNQICLYIWLLAVQSKDTLRKLADLSRNRYKIQNRVVLLVQSDTPGDTVQLW